MGIKHVYIDTTRGLDVKDAPTAEAIKRSIKKRVHHVLSGRPHIRKTSTIEEIQIARTVFKEAHQVVHDLLLDARLGRPVDVEKAEPVAEKIIDSVFRNKDALISLTRIKSKDQYTFTHSISVCALMVGFSHDLGFERNVLREIAIGALLHDIGKTYIDDSILYKPGPLTVEEFAKIKDHVIYGRDILHRNISETALNIAGQHHERIDGTGYPYGLTKNQLPQTSQMAAIVDVYDALTSARCYKQAWEPTHIR